MQSPQQEFHHKYHQLKTIIAERQAFEKKPENQIPPWINHPTTMNYCDVNGNTLLHYACLSGDAASVAELVQDSTVNIDQIQLFRKGGPTPLEMALQKGYLEIAKILYEKGAKCSHILLSKVHQDCKDWFKEKLIESFNISWRLRNDTFKDFIEPSPFFANGSTSITNRLIEINDLESVKKLDLSSHVLQQAILIAAGNGHIDILKFLRSRDAPFYPSDFSFGKTALHAAVEGNQYETVQYLLSKNVPINYQDNRKKTPLMLAVETRNVDMVKLLLDSFPDVCIKDVEGNNILHQAVAQNNPEIITLLFNHYFKKFLPFLLEDKNIYGFSSRDMAIATANDTLLSLIYQDNPQELENIKKSPQYGERKAPINHGYLLPKMHYYLTLNYRDTTFLELRGHCYGFSFLRDYFTSLEKNPYFYQVLQLISRWNGSNDTLQEAFPEAMPQAGYYANLDALLETWINWIIWLHGNGISDFPLDQHQIEEKFALLSAANDFAMVTTYKMLEPVDLTRKQLEEYLFYIQKMPEKMMFNITGGQHSTSGNILKNTHDLDYYDANFSFKPDPEQLKTHLIDILLDFKYYVINQTIGNKFPAKFHLFHFNNQPINWDHFRLFSPNELPKTKTDAEKFQSNSPNKFTHLHAALITGSYLNMEQLLQEKHCDVNAKDSFGRTILDMAIGSQNIPMISLILKYSTCGIDIGAAITKLSESEKDKQIKAILMPHRQPADLIKLCIQQIENNNIAYIENFIREHKDIINLEDNEGHSLLLVAVEENRNSIMEILIKNGASVTQKAMSTFALFVGETEFVSPLDIILKRNATHLFPLFLNCSSEIHTFMDFFHKENFKACQKVLETIQFNSNHEMHVIIAQKILWESLYKDPEFLIALIQKIDEKILNKIFENNPGVANILLLNSLKNNTDLFITLIQKLNEKILNARYNGKPLLVEAVSTNNFRALKALVDCKAFIDNQTEPGKNTALHAVLILKLDSEWCKFLLEHGAKTDIENKEQLTPAHLAKVAAPEIQALIVPAEYKPTLF